MKIRLDRSAQESLLSQARDQIVSALHAGVVRRGDRLPSLRQVADRSRLNVKTVLKVYTLLAGEGLLEMRRGSGAFVTAYDPGEFEPAQAVRLARFIRRHLDEASGMSLTPGAYASLITSLSTRGALARQSVVVLECNREQVDLYAEEITRRVGVKTHAVMLSDLHAKKSAAILRSSSVLAVTDFHMKEGATIAQEHRRPIIRLRLRRDFLPTMIDAARRGRVLMIVSSAAFIPAFKKALVLLGLHKEHLERITAVEGSHRQAVGRAAARADAVYLSPLCDRSLRAEIPKSARLISFNTHLDADSIEEIESWLLLSGRGTPGRKRPTA
ncbi:MAG: GntR family transcriptional regulator [Acidobacteria bacterium]|nr:GntR family transcriptional regulator [Acidobacteriota bacterium]